MKNNSQGERRIKERTRRRTKGRSEERRDFQRMMATLTASIAGCSRPRKHKHRLSVESSSATSSDDGASDSDN